MRFSRVPLAWLNLTRKRSRLLASSGGIAFAVLLMFMQTGFRGAMFDGQVKILKDLDADLIIVNSLKYSIALKEPFARRRLFQAAEIEGVKAARPFYVGEASWKNSSDRSIHPIRVLGFDPYQPVFENPVLQGYSDQLSLADTALFDSLSRQVFGNPTAGSSWELNDRMIRIVGAFELGADLINDGNLIMSDKNFLKFFSEGQSGRSELAKVDVGIIKLDRGANAEQVQSELDRHLPDDVRVFSKQGFIELEMSHWRRNSPIGHVFGFGAAMGFIIGVIICYQILYSDVSNQMPQFATVKAIGYQNRYLRGVVLQEALYLSILGFVPGLLLSRLLYLLISALTGLPLTMPMARVAGILVLTIVMCMISGIIALRKVLSADPAEVF